MGLEKLLQEFRFSKDSDGFMKSFHAGLAMRVLVDSEGWFAMPLIDVAKLPAPEGLPPNRLIRCEVYWPENSYNIKEHTASGTSSDLSAFRAGYRNIENFFERIAKFYEFKLIKS